MGTWALREEGNVQPFLRASELWCGQLADRSTFSRHVAATPHGFMHHTILAYKSLSAGFLTGRRVRGALAVGETWSGCKQQ